MQRAATEYGLLYRSSPENLDYGLSLIRVLDRAGRLEEASNTVQEVRKLPSPLRDDPRIDLAEAVLADSQGDYVRELAVASHAEEKGRILQQDSLVAQALLSKGMAQWGLGQLEESKVTLKESKRIFGDTQNVIGQNDALMYLTDVAYQQGQTAEADKFYEELLASYRSAGNEAGVAAALERLGTQLSDAGDLAAAETKYEESLRLRRQIGDKGNIAVTLVLIGNLLEQQGNLKHAREQYRRALSLSTEIGDKTGEASALRNLGDVLLELGNLQDSQQSYEDSLAISRATEDNSTLGDALLGMGDVLLAKGDLSGAEQKYTECLSIKQKLAEHQGIGDSEAALAALYLEQGRLSEAQARALDAVQQLKTARTPSDEAFAHVILARSLFGQNLRSEAEKALKEATKLAAKTKDARTLLNVAIVTDLFAASSGKTSEAKEGLEKTASKAADYGFYGLEMEARLGVAETQIRSGQMVVGHAHLSMIEQQCKAKGFLLLARKADAANK